MTERFERLFTFGPRPVNYRDRETWTEEVQVLYKRLQDGDHSALAPLLKWDIEFLLDPRAMARLIQLKYAPELKDHFCRAELRRIANVIAQRPKRRHVLPSGDLLEAELRSLTVGVEKGKLLEVKEDKQAILERLLKALPEFESEADEWEARAVERRRKALLGFRELPPASRKALKVGSPKPSETPSRWVVSISSRLHKVMKDSLRPIRKPRSWAIQALAAYYGVEAHDIDKRIAREIHSGRRRR